MHVRFPPELEQLCRASLRVDQGICGFPSRLSYEAFPRGFPTGLSHVPPWFQSILGLKVETVQGKQVSLEWTETSSPFQGKVFSLHCLDFQAEDRLTPRWHLG